MLMIKEYFPEAKFRNLMITQVDAHGNADVHYIDMEPFLAAISDYYAAEKPDVYKELKERKMFDKSIYLGTAAAVTETLDKIKDLPVKEQLLWVANELNKLTLDENEEQLSKNEYKKEKRRVLAQAYLDLTKIAGTDFNASPEDLTLSGSMLKGLSDIEQPHIKTFNKAFLEAKHDKTKEGIALERTERELAELAIGDVHKSNR